MAQPLTDTPTKTALSVAQVAGRIDGALRSLGDGWIEGEVTSISVHHSSGHVYLTLADESASLDACIWRGRASRCLPLPAQGDLVQAHFERVDFYAPRGSTKLILDRVRPTGEGELLRRRAETLRRLQADGLCDPARRKSLPAFPRRVGVIAARNDANVDVIEALRKRFPPQDIVFCAASVQGMHAVGSVIDALGRLQAEEGVDVIVLARGGGSTADLLAFDDERLCRAIFACAVPVITSIGHTRDRPNCDHVAAAFASVPAKAPELAVPHGVAELLEEFDRHATALGRVLDRPGLMVERMEDSLQASHSRIVSRRRELLDELDRHNVALARVFERPRLMVERMSELLQTSGSRVTHKRLDLIAALDRRSGEAMRELRRRLVTQRQAIDRDTSRLAPAAKRFLSRHAERVAALGTVIDARDFRRRGWVMAVDSLGRHVGGMAGLRPGDELALRFADGEASVTITNVHEGGRS